MSKRNFVVAALALTSLTISACNKASEAPPAPPSGKALMLSDRDSLDKSIGDGAQIVDQKSRRVFSKIFGGPTGSDVRDYVDERIKHYFTTEDLNRFRYVSAEPIYEGWYRTDEADRQEEKKSRESSEVGASNFGTGLFVTGMIEGRKMIIEDDTRRITLDSPRVGIMRMGPGYKSQVNVRGRTITIPASYRQSILVHEARHSDCSTDVSVDDFRVGRSASSMREFLGDFKKIECGHMHALCPKGHDLASLPACDRQPWGAYTVNLIFEMARLKDATDELERRVLEAAVAEGPSRLLFDVHDMLEGRMGEPKMDSGTIRW